MSDKGSRTLREGLARRRARLLEEVADIDRDLAELDRVDAFAAKYNLVVSAPAAPLPSAAVSSGTESPESISRGFDGSVASLLRCYQTDPDSPYKKIRFRTRQNYDALTKRIERDIGSEKVADLDGRRLYQLHQGWAAEGKKLAMAHSLVVHLRIHATYGATFLKSKECRELKHTLSDMQFPISKPRGEKLTAGHAKAIREVAHAFGLHSIALAQAFQFDCMLGQKDVIGEWVPIDESGPPSDVIAGDMKWLRGLRWSEIDGDLVLRHAMSNGGTLLTFRLAEAPMVLEEFCRMLNLRVAIDVSGDALRGILRPKLPTSGPIIVAEPKGIPWTHYEFRRQWRKIADAGGVPPAVKNMDSRAPARLDMIAPSRRPLRDEEGFRERTAALRASREESTR